MIQGISCTLITAGVALNALSFASSNPTLCIQSVSQGPRFGGVPLDQAKSGVHVMRFASNDETPSSRPLSPKLDQEEKPVDTIVWSHPRPGFGLVVSNYICVFPSIYIIKYSLVQCSQISVIKWFNVFFWLFRRRGCMKKVSCVDTEVLKSDLFSISVMYEHVNSLLISLAFRENTPSSAKLCHHTLLLYYWIQNGQLAF